MRENEAATRASGGSTRRSLLSGAGAVGASLMLGACAGAGSGANAGPGQAGDPASGGATGTRTPGVLGKASSIPIGGGVIFAIDGVVVTQPTAGTYRAFSSVCTHKQCPLAGIDAGTINCACHGSRFSIEDGAVRKGPATEPLPAKQIEIDGDDIKLV